MPSTPSTDDPDGMGRREYMQALAAASVLPATALGAEVGSTPDDISDTAAVGQADWSYTTSKSYLRDEMKKPDLDPSSGYKQENVADNIYLYTPHPSDLDVPEHDVTFTNKEVDEDRDHGWKYLVQQGTTLDLLSVLYLPFVGSGYWRYTFSLTGSAVAYFQDNWGQRTGDLGNLNALDPSETDGSIEEGGPVPTSETFAETYLIEGSPGQNIAHNGFDRHGLFLYQPDCEDEESRLRRPGELAIVTPTRKSGQYGRDASATSSDGEESDASNPVAEGILDEAASTVKGELVNRALVDPLVDKALSEGTDSVLKRNVAGAIADLVLASIDVEFQSGQFGAADYWKNEIADEMTDSWSVTSWRYHPDNARNPAAHQRLFSVDVSPIEDERDRISAELGEGDEPAAPLASRWSELRVSDYFRTDATESTVERRVFGTNDFSLRLPKLPRPEHADLFDYEIVPYCHVDDECVYVAPEVEPIATPVAPAVNASTLPGGG